jgi:hypothetical protein
MDVEAKPSEQIQDVIDVLLLAQSQARSVNKMMRARRYTFPLEYSYFDDDISHMISKLQLMKRVAERQGW